MSAEFPCPGCGARLAPLDGPAHPYIGASPACWSRYTELLGREYGEFNYPEVHRLTVDTYAVQHPRRPERRAIQSVCVHLMALCLQVEREVEPARVTRMLDGIGEGLELRWLEPPQPNGTVTVLDVLAADELARHTELVRGWAADVWKAWAAHHETVREWTDRALARRG